MTMENSPKNNQPSEDFDLETSEESSKDGKLRIIKPESG